jgi:E3 ubiquitin-protein ligase MARCH6
LPRERPQEPDRRLFAPCKCSGSIRFTHSDCLEQWLEHSGKTYCELCGHQFEFKPLYDANAPDVLPWSELLGTVLRIAFFKWLPFGVRAALVIVLWLAVAPWCTSWLYRMWLLRASAMVNVNFSERFDSAHVVADIFSGIVLIVCIVFSFLALMSFADFLRFHLDHIEEQVDEDNRADNHAHHHHAHHHHHRNDQDVPPAVNRPNADAMEAAEAAEVNGRDADPRLDEGFDEMGGVRQLGNLEDAESDDSSDEEEWGERDHHDHEVEGRHHDAGEAELFEDAFIRHPIDVGMGHHIEPEVNGLRHRHGHQENLVGDAVPDAARAPIAEAPGDGVQRAEPAAVPPRRNIRNRVNIPGPGAAGGNGNANREWEDDFEHMEINIAMDELLGLRGDIVVLFRNVSWLLAFNGAYLGLFAFIPYTLGSTLLSGCAQIVSAVPFSFSSSLASLVAATSDSEVPAAGVGGSGGARIDSSMPIVSFTIRTLLQAVEGAKARGDCLQLVDICTCLTGYFAICCTIVLWRFMVTKASSYIHRPLMGGLLWALRCLTAIVKVSTLLLLKMVVLPIVLGLGIDFATLHLFMVTPHVRVAFCLNQMIGALMVHWVLGITFMLFVTVAVLQLREVVHPDLLAKVIRPQEDHPDLLRTLLSEKCVKHARRMVLSLAVYAALLVVIVHVPVRIASAVVPSLFPLTLRFQYLSAEIQVPLELLAVHLVVLSVLEHAKNDIGRFQYAAIAFASKHLGLTAFLLPRIYMERTLVDSNMQLRRRVREEFVLAPPPLHFHPRAQLPAEELRVDGHRYLPWPEEGLDDPEPTEYELLPRRTPSRVPLRLSALVVFSWAVSVLVVGGFIFSALVAGRLCLAPFERVTGITHDPLVMAAGVEIVWFAVNGIQALQVLTRPIDQVAPALVQRGYSVKNLTPASAITCVLGWAFVCPFLLGHALCKCFPAAQSSLGESYMMGCLLLNLICWLVCTVRTRRRGGRRGRRNANVDEFDDAFIPDEEPALEDEFLDEDEEEDDLFDEEDDDEDLFDEEDDHHDDQELIHFAEDGPAAEGGGVGAHAHAHVARDNFVTCLRKSYRQLRFTLAIHESEVLRLRRDPIGNSCFDVAFFQDRVLWPTATFLLAMLIGPTFVASVVTLVLTPVAGSRVEQTAFALSALLIGSVYLLVRAHAIVSLWVSNLCESIRNERYLIGRQLQDMVR